MERLSIKEICNKIWNIEKKYNLFNKKISEIYFWKIIRFKIFLKVSQGNINNNYKFNFLNKSKHLYNKIKWHYINGAIKRKSQKEILIFESPRKKKIDGEYIDIYTNDLVEKLKNTDYELIEESYKGEHYNPSSKLRSYNDYFSIVDFIKYKVIGIKLSPKEKAFIKKLRSEINKSLNIELNDLELIIKRSISNFYYQYNYYDKLLKKRKPKIIYLVCSYGKEPLILASRKNNIKSIEIQHGTISKYHLGYSFPNDEEIPYFPDQINMFGEFWYDSNPIPLEKKNIRFSGYSFMENRIKKFKTTDKIKKQILFISQNTIEKKLSEIAYEFALSNKNYEIVYKLHPNDYKNWSKKYSFLHQANKLNNFKVLDSDEKDLYQLFFESEFLVGVYSTAIFEGLALGCKTILINIRGIEYREYLIENDFVEIANNSKELLQKIKDDKFSFIKKDYFFKNND